MELAEYLSPRDLGRAVGLSESSVRRWADDGRLRAERTAGGHRRIARAEAVRFIREAGLELLRPDLLGFPETQLPAEAGVVPASDALVAAIRTGDNSGARRILVSAFLEGVPLAALCDGPIQAALREAGTVWRDGPEGIVYEHRAVDVCLQALMEIRSAIPDRHGAPIAFGGAVEGDPYLIPTVMSAAVLADAGFRALNLGPNVPSAALIAASQLYPPVLVWRASAIPGVGPILRREARYFGSLPDDGQPDFVVGGSGFASSDLPREGRVHRLHSMSELAGFGRAVLARLERI